MAEPLKTFFSSALVRRLAADIERVHPSFPSTAFARDATNGLETLELLDRGKHIARTLRRHLPASYPDAIDILLRSLGPEHVTDELIGAGMAPFYYLPHTQHVATHGLDHFELSMRAQYELTKRFSAESSIRPFIAGDPERTFATLREWASDPNAHVRRLVSEGTRLRLPWAMRVPWLDANPERVIELLELLKDDPASLVRRSVANNLNDLGKVHPALLTRTCGAWLAGATAERRALVEHALRSAVKRGEASALRLLGYGKKAAVRIDGVRIRPARVTIGQRVIISFVVTSKSRVKQDLLVDLGVHFGDPDRGQQIRPQQLGEFPGVDRIGLRPSLPNELHLVGVGDLDGAAGGLEALGEPRPVEGGLHRDGDRAPGSRRGRRLTRRAWPGAVSPRPAPRRRR